MSTAKEELKKIIEGYKAREEVIINLNHRIGRDNIDLKARLLIANQTIADQKNMLMNGLGG